MLSCFVYVKFVFMYAYVCVHLLNHLLTYLPTNFSKQLLRRLLYKKSKCAIFLSNSETNPQEIVPLNCAFNSQVGVYKKHKQLQGGV